MSYNLIATFPESFFFFFCVCVVCTLRIVIAENSPSQEHRHTTDLLAFKLILIKFVPRDFLLFFSGLLTFKHWYAKNPQAPRRCHPADANAPLEQAPGQLEYASIIFALVSVDNKIHTSRKHAYIVLISLNPTFIYSNWGLQGYILLFLLLLKNIDCGTR